MSKWTTDQIPDQDGRIAIVTGANSGIGLETARALAHAGGTVIMACRNPEKAEAALADIKSSCPDGDVRVMQLDLSSLVSINQFVENFKKQFDHLDLLINNAGVMMTPQQQTADGFELQFGTNHLGHFALTGQLIDLILTTPGARIVNVSSMAHKFGKIDFDNLNAEKNYNKTFAYGQSKLANLLFTHELNRRLSETDTDVIATAAHPGWTATNLQDDVPLFKLANPIFSQRPPMGCLPTLRAAVDPAARPNDYFGPGGIAEIQGYPRRVKPAAKATDTQQARRLWDVSVELTGIDYGGLN